MYHNIPALPLNLLLPNSNTQLLLESPRIQQNHHLLTDFIPRIMDDQHHEILDPYNISEDEEDMIMSKKQESEGLFSRESGDINQNLIRNEEEELKIDS